MTSPVAIVGFVEVDRAGCRPKLIGSDLPDAVSGGFGYWGDCHAEALRSDWLGAEAEVMVAMRHHHRPASALFAACRPVSLKESAA